MEYFSSAPGFAHLSLADLLRARDQFHPHLVHKRNVVGTAVGRYLIRTSDPEPGQPDPNAGKPREPRTLESSGVRDYSWPCVLVFVDKWVDESSFGKIGELPASDYVPKTIYLDDGKAVPICVVLAPRVMAPPAPHPNPPRYEANGLLQGGARVSATTQHVPHAATVGCLLTDGHKVYALTSRHVAGDPGEVLRTESGIVVGTTSNRQLGRVAFEDVYKPWSGRQVFVNLDVALVELENLRRWSSGIRQVGRIGPLAALSTYNLSLDLIGAPVRTFGAASGLLEGRIAALFYRYKSVGGFDYVADFLIGSRTTEPLATRPGDSGAVWVVDSGDTDNAPIAVQWGGTVLGATSTTFALAANLSTIARELDVDVYRGPGVAAFEYWGPDGHSAIGQYACTFIENKDLKNLLEANIAAMRELANVPDTHWKESGSLHKQHEGPNHYADMDYKSPHSGNKSLDDLSPSLGGLDAKVWRKYYDKLGWMKTAERGLLPFRVWQCFNQLVEYIKAGDVDHIVAGAGVLAHYVGDACQPLHGSIYSQGDPFRDPEGNPVPMRGPFDPIYGGKDEARKRYGVHSTYESSMVRAHVHDIEPAVDAVTGTHGMHLVSDGRAAAWATIELMRRTHTRIDPLDMVNTYAATEEKVVGTLWKKYGPRTIETMIDGCKTLAMLWDSAWKKGHGKAVPAADRKRDEETLLTTICDHDPKFFPSVGLDAIDSVL